MYDTFKKYLKKNIYIISFLLLFLVICYFFPYTHDDWAWGSEIGIKRLSSLFKNYNGRWAGNILVILLTRNRILRTLTIFFNFVLTTILIKNITNKKNKSIIPIIIFLLLTIPIETISQTISWTSGFSNYCIPILIILYIIYLNKNIFKQKKYTLPKYLIPTNILIGFISSLFMEHMTIYNFILIIFIIFMDKKINKKINKANITYLIGALFGAIIMFSNGAYLEILNATDSYRVITKTNIIINSIKTYLLTINTLTIINNKIINIIMSSLFLIINLKNKNNKKIIKLSNYGLISFLSYNIFNILSNNSLLINNYNITKLFEGILVFIYLLSIILIIIYNINDKKIKFKLFFYISSIIIIILPLLIVSPLGPRCFYASYIFLILISLELFNYLKIENINLIKSIKQINIIILIFMTIIYFQIFFVETKRIYAIKNNNSNYLVLPLLPYENYTWNPNPNGETFIKRFKLYYKIEKETKIEFIPYKDWKNIKKR